MKIKNMIDTVVLSIPLGHLVFLDKDNKAIPDWDLYSRTAHYQKYIRNPSANEKSSGVYFPRLTLYRRGYGGESVKVEFSVPKLLHNNNLQELKNADFASVISALQDRMKRMGVRVFKHVLENASVSTIHYSKNIPLENGYTSSYIISQIAKIDLKKSFDFARSKYTNDGQSICAHTAAHELVIYDKIADLAKNKKRAIDRDQTSFQTSLFETLQSKKVLLEILRFEIRLCKKEKIRSVLKILKIEKELTFNNLFDSNISKQVVRHYWKSIINARNNSLFSLQLSHKDLLREIYLICPDIKPNRAIYLVGLILLARDGNGLRELRSVLEKYSNQRTWYRIISDHRALSELVPTNKVRDWVVQIEQSLKLFEPFTRLVE